MRLKKLKDLVECSKLAANKHHRWLASATGQLVQSGSAYSGVSTEWMEAGQRSLALLLLVFAIFPTPTLILDSVFTSS